MLRPAIPKLPPHRGSRGNPCGYGGGGGPASQLTEESGSYVPASAWLPLPILGDVCLLLELVSQIPILVIDYRVRQVNRKWPPLGLAMQQSWLRDCGLQLATTLPWPKAIPALWSYYACPAWASTGRCCCRVTIPSMFSALFPPVSPIHRVLFDTSGIIWNLFFSV